MLSTTKVAIIGLFAAILAAGAAAGATNSASERAIKQLCNTTSYPKTCVDALTGATDSTDPKTLIHVALQQTLKEIENRLKQIDNDGPSGKFESCRGSLVASKVDIQRSVNTVNAVDATADLVLLQDDLFNDLANAHSNINSCLFDVKEEPLRAGQFAEFLKVPRDLVDVAYDWARDFPELMKNSAKE